MAASTAASASAGASPPQIDLEALIQVPQIPCPLQHRAFTIDAEPSRVQTLPRMPSRLRHAAAEVQVCLPFVPLEGAPLTTDDRQCAKAGVECMFYDHGRKELLPRR